MKKNLYNQAHFLLSVAKLTQLPQDSGYEVAFAGRSNAGKSSALNCITSIKNLARTSKTPGRTQLINLFSLDDTRRLVDLPGYGYAKVSRETKEQWQQTLAEYLETRECLQGLMLVMDVRHPLKELDQMMVNWAITNQLPTHILLTKADKLSRGAAASALQQVRNALKLHATLISVQLFSALKHTGIEQVHQQLDQWFELGE